MKTRSAIRTCLLSGILLVIALPGISQVTQPYRFEKEQKDADDYFHIISLKEKGLALFRERDKYRQSNRIWELVFLDSTLQNQKTLELEIRERYKMVGYEVAPASLYFLFRTGETNKNDFVLIDVSLDGVETGRYNIKPDLDFRLTHFIKAGNSFVLGGYVNNEAVIIVFDTKTNNLKVVPGFFQKDVELVDLRTNQNQTFNTTLFDRSTRGERKLVFRTFDETGKQLLEDVVSIEDDLTLHTGISSALEREELVLAGTWGEKNSKQASGFFTLAVNPFAEQKINYVQFGELTNFVDYLNEKRAERVRKASKDYKAAGKLSPFTAYVMPFRLVEHKKGFYLLAEVYDPVHSNQVQNANPYFYNPYYPSFGYNPFWSGFYYPGMSRMYRPYMFGPTTRNSDEIKTLETVVFSFDAEGIIKNDYSLKLDDLRLPSLEQVGDFVVMNDNVYIIYKKESELKVKLIVTDNGETEEETQKIKTLNEQDLIRSEKEKEGGVRYWYGNKFYAWGYQTIRNTTKEDRVRDVFYINRVDTN